MSGTDPRRQEVIPVGTSMREMGEILRSRSLCPARPASVPLTGGTVLVLNGEAHFRRRRVESTLFSREALKAYELEVLDPMIDATLADLARARRGPDGLMRTDLVPTVRRMVLRIAVAVIGLDGTEEEEPFERLFRYQDELIEGATLEWSTRDYAEAMGRALEFKRRYADEFVLPSLARRRHLIERCRDGERSEVELPVDLLTRLLVGGGPEFDSDPDLIVRESVLYIVASTITTSTAATHLLRELTRWLAKHPEDAAHLGDRDFLFRAASESLRLHPASPAIIRRATEPVTLPTGAHLDPGQLLAADVVAANRDPAVWGPDGDSFDPHRELDTANKLHRYGYAFGSGVHVCIGQPLVLGTHTLPEDRGSVDGVLIRLMRRLFDAGVEMDPARPPVRPPTHQDRYASFPVIFRRL